MAKANQILEAAEETHSALLERQLDESRKMIERVVWENDKLVESISQLDTYLDLRGWTPLTGVYDNGPSLQQLHAASKRLRELAALNVHVGNGLRLRSEYVWDGGIHYKGIPDATRGRAPVKKRIDDPINQHYFFGSDARHQRETACYTDGFCAYIGDDETYQLAPLPISEITAHYENPDRAGEVWAYRRTWVRRRNTANPVTLHKWYFVNRFWDKRIAAINYDGRNEPVSQTERIFLEIPNSMHGWAYGVPDALAAIAWAEQYRQFLVSGKQMSDAMSKLWAQAKHNSEAGATSASIEMGGQSQSGGTYHTSVSNELQPLATAGQSYDFAKGIALLAAFAAGIGVSTVAVSANPGSAGSSYGAAKALDKPEQLMTTARRAFHIPMDKEVLVWMGANPADLDIFFDSIMDADQMYREIQAIMLEWGTGLYTPEQIKEMLAIVRGEKSLGDIPDGVMLPNNNKPENQPPVANPGNGANGGNFTPTQGSGASANPSGSGDQSSDDIRSRND